MLSYSVLDESTNTFQIDVSKFKHLINPNLQSIINWLQDAGFEVRIVGGCVRDLLLGTTPRDVDLGTTAEPTEVLYILSDHDIEVDAFGIKHSTIKAVIGRTKYDITTIAGKVTNQNGKIVVQNHGTWRQDAIRRDYSINSMSMTLDGKVYDYIGGLKDLKAQYIRPNPYFEQRIHEDPANILRFFRMLAKFPDPKYSQKTWNIILRNMNLVSKLKRKRVFAELGGIRDGVNGPAVIALIEKIGLMDILRNVMRSSKL